MRVDLRVPFAVTYAVGALLMIGVAILSLQQNPHLSVIIPALAAAYVLLAGIFLTTYCIRYASVKRAEEEEARLGTDIYRLFRTRMDIPYCVVNADGVVRVINAAMQTVAHQDSLVCAIPFKKFCDSLSFDTVKATAHGLDQQDRTARIDLPSPLPHTESENLTVPFHGRRYRILPYRLQREDETYYFLLFRDVEDYLALCEESARTHMVFAYIMLDNLQELTQYVRANYRTTANLVEETLTGWVEGMGGMLHEYDRDKYLAIFSSEWLDECIRRNFDILDQIMKIRVGDNSFPVSVSIGIADIDGTIKEREAAASVALDMALQRGGNQVALQRHGVDGLQFYGGSHKTIESNTAITSRVSAELLRRRMGSCDSVLIMPHANPDFDAIGSAVGAYRLTRSILASLDRAHVPVHIVTNLTCDTFEVCYASLKGLPEYEAVFIDKAAAQQAVTSGTLLIITDVNNPGIFESPQLAGSIAAQDGVSSIAVIDHHRLVSELPFTPFLHYIEATKSSASEIVAEILQQSDYADSLLKEEANLLLAGIMLDTHNFTRSAGSQTFEVTHYLYSRSAHTEVAREFFNERMEELLVSGDFDAHVRSYEDVFAITWLSADHTPSPGDRIAASKAADKLLGLRGVEASFAFAVVGNSVAVSARSKGRINVQLIMEKLDGGGHFDMAGAQVPGGVEEAYDALTAAIDEYKLQFPELFKKND